MKELSDEKRMLLAFVLMIAILGVWTKFFKPPVAPPPKPVPTASASATTPATASAPAATATATIAPPAGATLATSEEMLVVDNPVYRIQLSNRGASVRSWKLKSYLDDEKPPRPLELVNTSAAQEVDAWPFSIALEDP